MLTLDVATHTYRWSGRVVPSVSELISPLYAGAFDSIKADVLERKRTLGTALHMATELLDREMLDLATVDPAVAPYLAAYEKFVLERRPKWSLIEKMDCNPALGYAGTIDRAGTFDGCPEPAVVDYKTVAVLHPAVGVQLAGYARLIAKGIRRFALQLLPSGDYRLVEFDKPDDDACFMACLGLYHWRSKRAA